MASAIQFSPHALSEIYEALHQWDPENMASFQKYSEQERYCTMINLFVSTSLLWSTPWVEQLSIFNLQRRQIFDTDARISMWPHLRNELSPGHFGSSNDNGNPQRSTLDRFTRLGLVICDIALCFPITVNISDAGLVFSYRVKDVGNDLVPRYVWRKWVSAFALVRDVYKSMPGLWGAEVLSALSFGRRVRSAPTEYIDACVTLNADQKRLERFYKEFHKQRESQKPRKWMRSLEAKHDAMLSSVGKWHPTSRDHDNKYALPIGLEQQQHGEFNLRRKEASDDLRESMPIGEVWSAL